MPKANRMDCKNHNVQHPTKITERSITHDYTDFHCILEMQSGKQDYNFRLLTPHQMCLPTNPTRPEGLGVSAAAC